MKIKKRLFALTMVFAMMFTCAIPAFAAEASDDGATVESYRIIRSSDDGVEPMSVGQEKTFRIGEPAYLDNCGNNPKFEMWVTGGSKSDQVMFNLVSSGGTKYGPCGPVSGDGSDGWRFQRAVIVGGGSWQFTAYISSGSAANLVCHVKQVQ